MKYFIIDSLNLAHRAHNVNYELRTANEMPTGMFFGYLRMIQALKKKYRGYKFIVVWDNKAKHKFELQPDYKAGRTSLPASVMSQIPDIKSYLKNCGVDQYEKEGQEADDVIASLVEQFKEEGAETIIVYSNDKDFLQLVETGKVIVYKPKTASSPEKFYDIDAVKEKFGVEPDKLSYFRSFDGDSSDHITGVPRVPRKIIASMVNKYGDPESIYRSIDEMNLTEFQKNSFVKGKERVFNNLKIITLEKNLDNISKEESKFDKEELIKLLNKYEVKSIKPELMIDLFASSLNIKYTDPKPSYKLETFSLFG